MTHDSHEILKVALLGGSLPERDLGVLTPFARPQQETRSMFPDVFSHDAHYGFPGTDAAYHYGRDAGDDGMCMVNDDDDDADGLVSSIVRSDTFRGMLARTVRDVINELVDEAPEDDENADGQQYEPEMDERFRHEPPPVRFDDDDQDAGAMPGRLPKMPGSRQPDMDVMEGVAPPRMRDGGRRQFARTADAGEFMPQTPMEATMLAEARIAGLGERSAAVAASQVVKFSRPRPGADFLPADMVTPNDAIEADVQRQLYGEFVKRYSREHGHPPGFNISAEELYGTDGPRSPQEAVAAADAAYAAKVARRNS